MEEKKEKTFRLHDGILKVKLETCPNSIFDKFIAVDFGSRAYQMIQVYNAAQTAEKHFNSGNPEDYLESLRDEHEFRFNFNEIGTTMYLPLN